MMIDNIREIQKDLYDDSLKDIIININNYYDIQKGFILTDLLDEEKKQNRYYIYITKGILLTLMYFGYIGIFSLYNGKSNFTYKVLKKINENDFRK